MFKYKITIYGEEIKRLYYNNFEDLYHDMRYDLKNLINDCISYEIQYLYNGYDLQEVDYE